MSVYQILNWDRHFENDRSRKIDRCSFACVPNKQHGMGFCRIASEPDGAAIYGIWHMIVGACSQQSLPRDGWLTENGKSDGVPWAAADLALKFRRPETEILRSLKFLSSERVAWLIVHSQLTSNSRPTHVVATLESPPTHPEGRKEGIEGKKEDGANGSRPTSACDDSWIVGLISLPAYQGIDVKRELGKMQVWCEANRKQATRRRFVNWLNRCERPMNGAPEKEVYEPNI